MQVVWSINSLAVNWTIKHQFDYETPGGAARRAGAGGYDPFAPVTTAGHQFDYQTSSTLTIKHLTFKHLTIKYLQRDELEQEVMILSDEKAELEAALVGKAGSSPTPYTLHPAPCTLHPAP